MIASHSIFNSNSFYEHHKVIIIMSTRIIAHVTRNMLQTNVLTDDVIIFGNDTEQNVPN